MAPRKSRKKKPEPRRGTVAAIADTLIANPTATGGAVVMAAMAVAIMTNALALQAGRHPAPLFSDTSPFGAGTSAPPIPVHPYAAVPAHDEIGALLGGEPMVDPGLVADIQTELKRRGYYDGPVDGLIGPITSDAILRFEQDHRLKQTGEATSAVLAELRSAANRRSEVVPPVRMPAEPAPVVATREPAAADATREPAPPIAGPIPIPKRPPPRAGATGAVMQADGPVPSARVEQAVLRSSGTPIPQPAVGRPVVEAPTAPAGDPKLARVQEALDLLGYGPLKADGTMSRDTRDAIRRFEENRDLPATGEINQRFLDELVKIGGFASR
ncbi:peptidoglycan-binding domain-containing protein [Chthonobacter albigriseus]|uniref:peptidoglycan-binding domain-containing protein n=1 Tax=Chthonobacter albigriseus TaxID=1683161 RepID=UPI0015EF09DD|nr:peptidoglycan-binding domain-containing protein [Chthonobacter albigriseus]